MTPIPSKAEDEIHPYRSPRLRCRIFKVDPENPEAEAIQAAAQAIRRGGLVAFPTETVYGLGADAFNERAVRKIFEVKGRPPDNPLIVHVSEVEDVWRVAASIPEDAWRLAERAWPGPLTIVVPKDPGVPGAVTAGLPTVAVRMPAHPVALSLIRESGTPIAAPSANPSGRPSPTRGDHVVRDLDCMVDVILDGGETFFGLESTIIDFTRDPPVLLRPGPYPLEAIERIIGRRLEVPPEARGLSEAERPLAPGMKYRHYAPETPLSLVDCPELDAERVREVVTRILEERLERGLRVAILSSSENRGHYEGYLKKTGLEGYVKIIDLGSRSRLEVVARRLFEALRELDVIGVDLAISEPFPERGVGLAVMNRLRKASSERLSC